jgi:hypothetical protein
VGVTAPWVRRHLTGGKMGKRTAVVSALAWQSPIALMFATRPSRARAAGVYALQMWAYLAHYDMPDDDPDWIRQRLKVRYPIVADRFLGRGEIPTLRLQRTLAKKGRVQRHDTFDAGVISYWLLPTAPPWWAGENGYLRPVRRIMVEAGTEFWGELWQRLYDSLGRNPFAAMPSLHFGTSIMAAHVLGEVGRKEAIAGWTYATGLGFALVYLGEHYVTDLLAGFALAEAVRFAAPRVAPAAKTVADGLRRITPESA